MIGNRWISWIRNRFRRDRVDRDLDAEINAHVQLLTDENVANGLGAEAARRQALLATGGVEQVKEEVRSARTGLWLEQLWQDIRYGIRMLRKSPGFSTLAIVTLALGIGANTAMFSVIDGVVLQPPPFPDSSRVMFVWQKMPNGGNNIFSIPDYLEWKRQNSPVSRMAALAAQSHTLGTGEQVERIMGWNASWEMFSAFGVAPIIGRPFTAAEDVPGGPKVVLLGETLWKTHFEADPKILGRSISLDGEPYTVIGVMPSNFSVFSATEQFWTPLQLEPQDTAASSRAVHRMFAVVRLERGMSLKQAQAAIDTAAANLRRQDPQGDAGVGVQLQRVQDSFLEGLQEPLWLLMGCVGFVLLIACSNVANLLLARGSARRLEMSIRAAVGAQRGRVMRQLLTESVLLSFLGGVLGLLIAFGALKALLALHPTVLGSLESIKINLTVLGFTFSICVLVGILFGLAPAWTGSDVNLSNALREAGRTGGGAGEKKKRVLVIAETALASVLLVGAGLALKSLWKVHQVDPGFNPSGLMTFRLDAPATRKDQPYLFYGEVVDHVRALPGVSAAALVRDPPMSGIDPSMPVAVDGAAPQITDGKVVTRFRVIGPEYFRTFQTPLLEGREFNVDDGPNSQPVVIISQSLKQRYWPGQNPLGRTLKPNLPGAPWYTVVGVVGDVRHDSLDFDASPTAYYPYTQIPKSVLPLVEKFLSIAMRTNHPAGLMDSVRHTVAAVDSGSPVYDPRTMDEQLAASESLRRLDTWLISAFAGLALLLAGIGVYGVMSYSVSQRTREIGIRMAMGARRVDVLCMIVTQGLKIAVAGIVVGMAGSLALAKLMTVLVYDTSTRDFSTFLLVGAATLGFILLASYIPSLRATRVDPNVALRHE